MTVREVWVVEWLHPDGTWHVENDFIAPAFFTESEAKRNVEIISGGMAGGIRRRVTRYIPSE